MRVATEDLTCYPEDPTRYFGFDGKSGGDFTLRPGIFDFSKLGEGERAVYLEFEEPNRFCEPHPNPREEAEPRFHRILTICPYTAEWMNSLEGSQRRVPIFFPFNPDYAPPPRPKEYDVAYCGGLVHWEIMRLMTEMSWFHHAVVCRDNIEFVTHQSVGYREKLEIMARSRISVVHNLIHMTPRYITYAWQVAGIQRNRAFSEVARGGQIVPQLKSRLFEAAFCRSLILCRRDPWNLVERYFIPDREFMYYEDGQLPQTIGRILQDFDRYQPIIENAYVRAMREYTTDAFFERYLAYLE